jgi:hypothetical protein
MISVCQIYTDFKGANNTWQQGHFRPHNASLEIFNGLRKEWENNQVITDALRPFFMRVQVPMDQVASGGLVAYPEGYASFSGLRYMTKEPFGPGKGVLCKGIDVLDPVTCKYGPVTEEDKLAEMQAEKDLYERDITKVDSQRWGSVMEHEFIGPSMTNVYGTQDENGFRVVPKDIGPVILTFLALPVRPKFVYTTDDNHNIICDPNKCTNLLWGEEMLPDLMSRLKTKYGSFVSNAQKWAEGMKETQLSGN